jgi:hypothetical protein
MEWFARAIERQEGGDRVWRWIGGTINPIYRLTYGAKSTLVLPTKRSANNYPQLHVLASKFLIPAPSGYDPR